MDYQRITDVPAVSNLSGNDSIYIRQGDTFRRVSIPDFLQALGIQDGNDGVSPTVTITTIPGGHRLTITDADGPKSFDVMDGGTSDFITFGGSCSTAANVQAKVVQSGTTGIGPGATLYANFAYANTAANPTLSAGGITASVVGPNLQPIEAAVLTAGLHQLHLLAYLDATGSATTVWVLLDKAGRDGQDGAPGADGLGLPAPGEDDNGKVPVVRGGEYTLETPASPVSGVIADGYCGTAANAGIKVEQGYINQEIVSGTVVIIYFANANTHVAPKLKVNGVQGPIIGSDATTGSAGPLTKGLHIFVWLARYSGWWMLDGASTALMPAVEEGLA